MTEPEDSVVKFHTTYDNDDVDENTTINTTAQIAHVPVPGATTDNYKTAAPTADVNPKKSDHLITIPDLESSTNIITAGKEQVVIDTTPETKVEEKKSDEPKVGMFELFRYAEGWDYAYLFVGVLGSVCAGLALPAFSILFGYLMNSLNPADLQSVVDDVRTYSLYFIYVGIGTAIASWAEVAMFMIAAENQCVRIRMAYVAAILRQPMEWHDQQTAGELTSRLATDTKNIQDALGQKFGNYLHHLSTFLGGLIVGFIYGWQLALLILGMTPLLAVAGGSFAAIMSNMSKSGAVAYGEAGSIASEVISAMRTVTTFGGQKYEEQRYVEKLDNACKIGIKKQFMQGTSMGVTLLVVFGTYGLALWFGAFLIYEHYHNPRSGKNYTGGDVSTVFFSVLMAAMALGQGAPNIPAIALGQVSAAKLFGLIDKKSPIDPLDDTTGEKLDTVKGKIEFKDVTFAYPTRSERTVLKNFNLTVQAGETVALVGGSGCGKSTIVALLERFYDPLSGAILVDGHDIKTLNVRWWRQQVGLVQQEPLLFASSIAENIAYGKSDATEAEIESAARSANADHFIKQFPKGYQTLVGEEGRLLSGGQKQRVAIARAIIKSPALLLLDEATSALDTDNEAIVQAALDHLMREKSHTTFVIAHRLTTVRRCDRIIVLEGGVIQEMGSHDELIVRHGAYYHFVKAQAKHHDKDHENVEKITSTEEMKTQASPTEQEIYSLTKSDTIGNLQKAKELIESEHILIASPVEEEVKKAEEKKKDEKTIPDVPFTRILAFNKPDWYWFLLGALGAAATGISWPMFSLIFSGMMSTFFEPDVSKQKHYAAIYAGLFAGLGGACMLASFTQFGFLGLVGEHMTRRLRHLSFQSMLRQHIGWYDDETHNTGTLVTRLANDTEQVNGLTSGQLSQMIQVFSMIIAGLTIAFINGWKLALVVLAAGPCITFAGWLQMKFIGGFSVKSREAAERAGSVANESITNIRTVASFNAERPLLKNFDKALQMNRKIGYRTAQTTGIGFGFSQLFLFISYGLCFLYGATLIQDREMDFEQVMRVFFAIIMCAMGIGQATQLAPDYQKAKQAANAIFHLFDTPSQIDSYDESGEKLIITKAEIVFENVSFVYPTRLEAPIFEHFSLRIPAKKKMALVGGSGSGKSTTIALLQRFYKGLGAVLMQEGRPVAFLSQTLSYRVQTKSVYERELMAIVMAVQKWRHYLLGRHFIILTDQKSLKFLTEQRVMGEEYFRWTSKLMGLDFEIQYRPGKENGVADALSRKMTFSALSSVHFEQIKDWETEIHHDPKLQGIIHDLIQDINSHPGYKFQNQKLFYKGRLVLPKGSSRIPLLLQEFHNSAVGGHSGFFRTYKRISEVVYWEGMRKDIQQHVATCEVCQMNKYQALSPAGLLQPLPIATQV